MIRRCGGLMWTLAARKRLGRKRIETNEPPRLDGKPDGARSVRVMEWPRRSGAGGGRRVLAMTKRLVYIYIGNASGRFLELQRRFFTVSVLKFLDLALPSLRNLPWSRGGKKAFRHRGIGYRRFERRVSTKIRSNLRPFLLRLHLQEGVLSWTDFSIFSSRRA